MQSWPKTVKRLFVSQLNALFLLAGFCTLFFSQLTSLSFLLGLLSFFLPWAICALSFFVKLGELPISRKLSQASQKQFLKNKIFQKLFYLQILKITLVASCFWVALQWAHLLPRAFFLGFCAMVVANSLVGLAQKAEFGVKL